MDLHKVTFPTFVLEPRSMLERITDFMSHPDLIFGYLPFSRLSHKPLIRVFTAGLKTVQRLKSDSYVFCSTILQAGI
jgi:hypothetical protein